MKIKQVFRDFLSLIQSKFPEQYEDVKITEETYTAFEEETLPHMISIFQKDSSIFENTVTLFGKDFSLVWKQDEENHSNYWKHLQSCAVASFLNGDIRPKLAKILPILAPIVEEFSDENSDEINKILNDKETTDKIGELFDFLKDSCLLNILFSFFEKIDLSELNVKIDENNIEKSMQDIKNSPIFTKLQDQLGNIFQEKINNGEISQQKLVEEIETIKIKLQTMFGDMFNEMLGGRKNDGVQPEVLLSTSPDARRARMIARMRRKVEEKRNGKNSS